MIFRPFYYFDTGCAASFLGCGTLGKSAVVDPQARDVSSYIEFAEAKGMRITHCCRGERLGDSVDCLGLWPAPRASSISASCFSCSA
jgi:hypothetical protein